MSCSRLTPIRVARHESEDIPDRYLRQLNVLSTKVVVQETANDSTALISRALSKTTDFLEVFGEAAYLLPYSVWRRPQKPRNGARIEHNQQMSKCSTHIRPASRNGIGARASRQMVVHEVADKSIVNPGYGCSACSEPMREVRDAPDIVVDGTGRVARINKVFAVVFCEVSKNALPQPCLRSRS
jgi:hypothetical protein